MWAGRLVEVELVALWKSRERPGRRPIVAGTDVIEPLGWIGNTYGLVREAPGIWRFRRASGESLDARVGCAGSSFPGLCFPRLPRQCRAPMADGCRRRLLARRVIRLHLSLGSAGRRLSYGWFCGQSV
jgi:hypothetical protein